LVVGALGFGGAIANGLRRRESVIVKIEPPYMGKQDSVAFRNICDTKGLVPKDEYHVTVLGYGGLDNTDELDEDKARESMILLREWYYCEKIYNKSKWVGIPHTRKSVIQAVQSDYLDNFRDRMSLDRRFFHVTLAVGCVEGLPHADTGWKHGIGIKTLSDEGLIVEKVELELY